MRDVLGFSVAFSVLVLSNLPQLVIIALCVGFYILLHLNREKIIKQIGRFVLASVLTLAGTSFYWWRMFDEKLWINHYLPNSNPDYDYRSSFLSSVFEFDTRGLWLITLIFVLTILWLFFSAIVTGKITNIFKHLELRRLLIILGIALFLSLPLSKLVWTNAEFLQRVQFPWRFLSVLTAITCIITAYCFSFINRANLINKRPLILLLIGLSLMFLTFSIRHISWGGQAISSAEFTQYADSYRQSKDSWHWMPIWTRADIFDEKEKAVIKNRAFEMKAWEAGKREFFVTQGETAEARIAVFYYSYWQVFINGEKIQTRPSADGALMFDVPTEESTIVIKFVEPSGTEVSRFVSLSALLLIIGLFICSWRKK